MSALKEFSLSDLDSKPITLGYHKQAIEAQQRAAAKLTIPFPAYNLTNEAASYAAHRAQAEKVIDAAMDLIIAQIEILRDMGEERKTDRSAIREIFTETVSNELYDADQYFGWEAAE